MSLAKQAIASLTDKLHAALAAGNWEAIVALDEECRDLIAALGEEDAYEVALREQLAELSHLYEELHRAGKAERERLVLELTRLNQSKQVKQAYKPIG